MTRTYSQLSRLPTFEERFEYLVIGGEVGARTFGTDRWINQEFYTSREWRKARDIVIIRDAGCDLGIPGREIHRNLVVHHINPMTPEDIIHGETWILDPEFLIVTSDETHNAIHYGNGSNLRQPYKPREPGDTDLWAPITRR